MMTNDKKSWQTEQTYLNLPSKFYKITEPEPAENPELVLENLGLKEELGLEDWDLSLYSGNRTVDGVKPLSQSYAGHQFGQFTMLGDGRAHLIAEIKAPNKKRYDVQLKGSGKTPYSRAGDGRAALGPMMREYMISEAMHALGVPTSRSLALVKTGEKIMRERPLDGAVLTRVSSSHLRVGTFEFAVGYGDKTDVKALADYAIERHDPFLKYEKNPYPAFAKAVMRRQAKTVAKWMAFGFVHGVMNTDNMTISGETIDYGPCAFIDFYDPNTVFSSIDHQGRYRYNNQPAIAQWNLARFIETLLDLFSDDEEEAIAMGTEIVQSFASYYEASWLDLMRKKLGLEKHEVADKELVNELLSAMEKYEADYTNTFLHLTHGQFEGQTLYHSLEFKEWYKKWQERLSRENNSETDVFAIMKKHNPAIIPRNQFVEETLAALVEDDDMSKVSELMELLQEPFTHNDEQMEWSKKQIYKQDYITYCGT